MKPDGSNSSSMSQQQDMLQVQETITQTQLLRIPLYSDTPNALISKVILTHNDNNEMYGVILLSNEDKGSGQSPTFINESFIIVMGKE